MLIYDKSRFHAIESCESEMHKDFFDFCECHADDMSFLCKSENYIGNQKFITFRADDGESFQIETVFRYGYTDTYWIRSDCDYRKHFGEAN